MLAHRWDHADPWAELAFPHPLRRYQRDALSAFERVRDERGTRAYLVLPPGAGKTVTGLEAARRLGQRTVVLTPNVAVQQQWLAEWRRFWPGPDHPLPGGSDRGLSSPLTVLTYQSIAVLARDAETTGDDGPDARVALTPAQVRRQVLRTGTDEELLALLHPNGRAVVERAVQLSRQGGPLTLVLDECHHLLELWGALLRALIDALGPGTAVVALTATPSEQMTPWQRTLHDDLFDRRDFFVPTPAVVKEGDLAPFQELLYLCEPTVEEDTWVHAQSSRFDALALELSEARFDGTSVLTWLPQRLDALRDLGAARLPWLAVMTAEPGLARAALRMVHAGLIELPEGAVLREQDRTAPDAADWACVLSRFALEHLAGQESAQGRAAFAEVKAVLPMLGVRLAGDRTRAVVSPVDKLVELSSAKHGAAVHILATEFDHRGFDLRALVLCDFEREGARPPAGLQQLRRRAVGGAAGGSARMALVGLAAATLQDVPGMLRPVLVTGRTLAAPVGVAAELRDALREAHPELVVELDPFEDSSTLVELRGPGLTSRVWTPVVTAFFAAGRSLALVGTRGLLGEGWDCPALNVVVDLTSAATSTSVAQLRGRSLRRDPDRPDKIANNWSVACLAQHPRGDADYQRVVRKHASLLALSDQGIVETGIGHCDAALSPYTAPDPALAGQVTARALQRAGQLDQARAAWRVGEPYAGTLSPTLRLRANRTLGVAPTALPPRLVLGSDVTPTGPRSGPALRAAVAALVVASPTALLPLPDAAAGTLLLGAPLLAGAGSVAWHARRAVHRSPSELEQQSGVVLAIARAVARALHDAGLAPVGADGVAVTRHDDGTLALTLTGRTPTSPAWSDADEDVGEDVVRTFVRATEEALAPVGEPRYLIARPVVRPLRDARERAARAARVALGRPVEGALVWHAVPTVLSRSAARVTHLAAAWEELVCGGRRAPVLRTSEPEGQGVLAVVSGADPYGLTAQMRTVWT